MNNKNTDRKLGGKVALVTGASKGIGASIASIWPVKERLSSSTIIRAKSMRTESSPKLLAGVERRSPFRQISLKGRRSIAFSRRREKPSAALISS